MSQIQCHTLIVFPECGQWMKCISGTDSSQKRSKKLPGGASSAAPSCQRALVSMQTVALLRSCRRRNDALLSTLFWMVKRMGVLMVHSTASQKVVHMWRVICDHIIIISVNTSVCCCCFFLSCKDEINRLKLFEQSLVSKNDPYSFFAVADIVTTQPMSPRSRF